MLTAAICAAGPARAQHAIEPLAATVNVPKDAQMFLESDTVTYDSDTGVVTAAGGVKIDYGAYKLVAREVVYDQKTKHLVAKGDVELVQPDGNHIYADSADITDDFANGFIRAMRIETPDKTRFAAAGAVRENGEVTTFEQGVYTACEPCREHPERAPLWQVKARKIVWNQQEKIVRYYGARFELFGQPIAYLPYYQAADPTVKRKSGFLTASYEQKKALGSGLRVPYFFAISDSRDMTVAGTYYTRQGFLGEVEYRQAFGNGFFTLQAAGISQKEPDAFVLTTPDYGTSERGMIGSTGRFALSDRWTVGWDILAQTEQNFSHTYQIENFQQTFHTSEIYLSGLGDRSFFDLRAQRFDVQTDTKSDQEVQPDVFPSLDYQRIDPSPVGGGELEVKVNAMHLERDDAFSNNLLRCDQKFAVNGGCSGGASGAFPFRDDVFDRGTLKGGYSRATAQAEWRRNFTTDDGLILTPQLGLRGDITRADMSIDGFPFPADAAAGRPVAATLGGIDIDQSGARGMATAGLTARYPILIETASTSSVVEPIAQLLVRPDEMDAGTLPNEDAQSLVFDTTNLFEADKFSGYDRIEGGTRANVGLRYAGTFATGYSLDAMVGQSYHLAGKNSYSAADLALVGYDSGLETDQSDYVASAGLGTPIGVRLGAQGRFDEASFELRRTDVSGSYGFSRGSVGLVYSFIGAQPIYGFPVDRRQITASGNLKLSDDWTAYASVGYDLENSTLISRSFGVGYVNDCFSLVATYQRTEDSYQLSEAQNRIMFKLGLRTLADTDFSYNLE